MAECLISYPFQEVQKKFTQNIRHPENYAIPQSVSELRMKIYQRLIYNNIEDFISNGFPILRSITSEAIWHEMIRDFIHRHVSTSPYFCEIGIEFLKYLQNERNGENDPPFMLDLAHFEWVELAIDISEEDFPATACDPMLLELSTPDLLSCPLYLSPLAWVLVYRYPVHRISSGIIPAQSELTHLLVYRNRDDQVECLEINQVTARLLTLFEQNTGISAESSLDIIASELNLTLNTDFISHGKVLFEDMISRGVLFFHL